MNSEKFCENWIKCHNIMNNNTLVQFLVQSWMCTKNFLIKFFFVLLLNFFYGELNFAYNFLGKRRRKVPHTFGYLNWNFWLKTAAIIHFLFWRIISDFSLIKLVLIHINEKNYSLQLCFFGSELLQKDIQK